MCGTPLPHRPLTAPGAQGTHSFTRVPQESVTPAKRGPAPTSAESASGPDVRSQTGAPRNGPATSQSENSRLPTMDMVPEVPLDEYVKSFRYTPPADPAEITMRGEAHSSLPEALIEVDASTPQPEATTLASPNSISHTEDVRERLGLEDDSEGDERRDRPRFLDINGPAVPPGESATPEAIIAGPSFLGLSDVPRDAVEASGEADTGKRSRASWRTWLAVAALLVFAALGVLEWRSQVNQTNTGPVEVVKVKLRELMGRYNSPPPSPNSTDANAAKPAMQVEEQPKSQTQEPSSSNLTTPAATSVTATPATADANAGAGAATSQPNTAPPAGTQLPAAQKTPAPVSSSAETGMPAASAQKVAPPKPTPSPETAKAGSAPSTADVNEPAPEKNAPEKTKPQPPTEQEANQDAPVKKALPGAEEVAKANNASDSAAAAAWLWKAMAKGNPDAPVRLANMYVKGDGVPRSCEQALVLLQAAATKGDARARSRLAAMYNDGTCVQRNPAKAYRWLMSTLAADPNSRWAQQNRELFLQQMTPDERAQVEKSQ